MGSFFSVVVVVAIEEFIYIKLKMFQAKKGGKNRTKIINKLTQLNYDLNVCFF